MTDLIETLRDWSNWFFGAEVFPNPERSTLAGGDGPIIEVAIHSTESLRKHRGMAPERMVANYVAQAIDEAGFGYVVLYGFEEAYVPSEDVDRHSNKDLLRWWQDASPEHAEDSNLLLTDKKGGGRAYIGMNNAVCGMNRVRTVDLPATVECDTEACNNIWAGIHEVGHNLGGEHSTPMMEDKPSMRFHSNMVDLLNERGGAL